VAAQTGVPHAGAVLIREKVLGGAGRVSGITGAADGMTIAPTPVPAVPFRTLRSTVAIAGAVHPRSNGRSRTRPA